MNSNNRGSSLIEILIAVGMMGILLMIFSQAFMHSRKQLRLLESKQEQLDFMTGARLSFMVPAQCLDNMANITFTAAQLAPAAVTTLRLENFRINGTNLEVTRLGSLRVSSLKFTSISNPTPTSSLGELDFEFDYAAPDSDMMKLANKKLPLYVRINGAGQVVECGQSIAPSDTPTPTPTPVPGGGEADLPCPAMTAKRLSKAADMRLPDGHAGQFIRNTFDDCTAPEGAGVRDLGWSCQYGRWTSQTTFCGGSSGGE